VTGPNGIARRVRGLIDTGADSSSFPAWYSEEFGYHAELLRMGTYSGASGPGRSLTGTAPCRARVPGVSSEDTVELSITPSFLSDLPTVIWGRLDFMMRYDLTIFESQKRFMIAPAPTESTAH
jgi:hypothetical protein